MNYIEKYVPKKYRDAIVDIDKDMDGWWAYLTDDYISTTTECHTIHELTLAEFKKSMHPAFTVEVLAPLESTGLKS